MSFVIHAIYLSFINILLALCFTFFLSKWLAGWYLRRRAHARREIILARTKIEEHDYQSKLRHSPKSDDGEWEKLEKSISGSATNREKLEEDWEGIVGFFHPFW